MKKTLKEIINYTCFEWALVCLFIGIACDYLFHMTSGAKPIVFAVGIYCLVIALLDWIAYKHPKFDKAWKYLGFFFRHQTFALFLILICKSVFDTPALYQSILTEVSATPGQYDPGTLFDCFMIYGTLGYTAGSILTGISMTIETFKGRKGAE